jgi:cation:H+ antiporter
VTILFFVLGLALLVGGAEILVKGAARLAVVAGIAPLVIGLTVVAFGTSAPELAVTIAATVRDEPDIALGNVVGSNITNVLLILGLSALVAPLAVKSRLIRIDLPILIVASAIVAAMAMNGTVSRAQGAALLAGGLVYTVLIVRHARIAEARLHTTPPIRASRHARPALNIAYVLAGLALLILGSRWLVESARTIAEILGISHLAIGLTVVAIGTSLPELATSVVAGVRGHTDMAVGNLLGSNLFNLLIVLGAGAALSPAGIATHPTAVAFDIPFMLAVTIACLPVFYTGRTVSRWEGALFLGFFVAYTTYVLVVAGGATRPPPAGHALLVFVVPLTTLAVVIPLLRGRI